MRRLTAGVTVAGITVLLSGCVSPPSPFDGARTDDDTVPPIAVRYIENADLASSRLQGDADDHALYLLKGTGQMKVCLVYTDGTADGSMASCGGGDWLKMSVADGAEFEVQLAGFPDEPTSSEIEVSPWVRQTRVAREQ